MIIAAQTNIALKRIEWLSKLFAYISLIVGALVLLGWVLHIEWLKSVLPGFVSMKVNTAIGFVLLGMSQVLNIDKSYSSVLARSATLFVLILSVLTFLEYVSNINFGIDQLILRDDPGAIQTANLGRMAPLTAISFILLSFASLLYQYRLITKTAQVVSISVVALGFISLIGYAYGVRTLFQTYNYTSMALHTTLLFVLLGLSLLFSRPQIGVMTILISSKAGGVVARRILPMAILTPFLVGWIHVETEHFPLLPSGIAEAILDLISVGMFSTLILWIANAFNKADISRELAEEKLKESEEHFRSVTQSANDAIITADRKGIIFGWNHGAEKIFGYTESEVNGKELSVIIPENYIEKHLAGINGFERNNDQNVIGKTVELMGLNKVGKEFPVELSLAEWETLSGKYYTAIIRDITERKRVEEDIKKSNEELLKLNAEKDKFFSIIAHDLKSPFNGLLGLTELMANDAVEFSPAEFVENSKSLNASAHNLYKLLENLLEWAQIQNGSIIFTPKDSDLSKMVFQSIDTIIHRAIQKQITIINEVDNYWKVYSDERMVNTTLRNLLSNAIKFTQKNGKVIVKSERFEDGTTKISVIDNGVGIPEKNVKRLFQIEEKVSSPGTEGELSTGLGLLLCKEFVGMHGGKIGVESQEGIGSVFYFTLPTSIES